MGPAQFIASSTLHPMTERTQFPKDQALLKKMLDKQKKPQTAVIQKL
jgi:hypothetical protein